MAEHGKVDYATAAGNDYPEHENTYEKFVNFAFAITIHLLNLMLGLAVGGVMGHWMLSIPVFIIAIIGLIPGLATGSRTSSYVAFVLCFLIFAFTGLAN